MTEEFMPNGSKPSKQIHPDGNPVLIPSITTYDDAFNRILDYIDARTTDPMSKSPMSGNDD